MGERIGLDMWSDGVQEKIIEITDRKAGKNQLFPSFETGKQNGVSPVQRAGGKTGQEG